MNETMLFFVGFLVFGVAIAGTILSVIASDYPEDQNR